MRKRHKKYTDWEKRNKTVFTDDLTLCIEQNNNEYTNEAEYKINIKNPVDFLCLSSEKLKF